MTTAQVLKRQSLSTGVLFRTTITRKIRFNLLTKWLLGSNLSQLRYLLICLCMFFQELEEIGQKNINEYTKLLEEHQHILEEVKQLEEEISKPSE